MWPAVVTLQYAVVIDSSRRPPENEKETRSAIGEAKQKLIYYGIDILLGLDENVQETLQNTAQSVLDEVFRIY